MKELLIVLTKNPVRGKVKTRLAKTIGEDKALAIFKKLLQKSANTASEWGGDVWVFYGDFIPKTDVWSGVAKECFLQKGNGLGERMSQAFRQAFEVYDKVILIGTDIPAISAKVISDAFEVLRQKDFVVGPTMDGGYYLIGMKTDSPFVFENMEWSTAQVFVQTSNRIIEQKHTMGVAKRLSDVDYEADLKDFGWLLAP